MGVPKFFRYISERYPCLSELARENSIPEFDNLYLDMNGIVHNCSHPDDNNIHFHLEETQIFQDIYNYIDKLFYLIKPQKLFFLAVDGVAPRAKMNQQRSRRFRSAREAEVLEAKALQRGEKRQHERFDSNCITPGTEFMVRLQNGLRCFLRTKVSTDPLWQKCRVILSGQETPGEGEHKIMDYIRYMKAQPNYDPNTRHCLYGLDADLIILGMCTHELHFVVLREEVKFGRSAKRTSVEETRFFLLHLGLLREYLELEFHELSTPENEIDIAELIDDWVLMSFMVGNDFIPHLPCLHISSNAFPLLYKTYIRIYKQLGGNINEHGKLNLDRLQQFMDALSEVELQLFEEHSDALKYINAKTEAFDVDIDDVKNDNAEGYNDDLTELIDQSMQLYEGDSDVDLNDEKAALRNEFENYKRNYYRNKFKNELQENLINQLGHHYVKAIQWILDYYYRGVQSWDWYYPYHYAPFISDLTNIRETIVKFSLGRPFLPFQQLLAVLPAASVKLLPVAYHDLMLKRDSPLAEFYPTEFESDLNGKKNDWEAVVLIPFIEESRLLSAMADCEPLLKKEERERNRHGPMYQYDYTLKSQGPLKAIPPLKSLKHTFCTERARWAGDIALNLSQTVCVELKNAARHVFFPGFPTLRHLPFDFELRYFRVKVFEQPSRNRSMVLLPKRRPLQDILTEVANEHLGNIIYIGWPHLVKARVVNLATREKFMDRDGVHDNDSRRFDADCKSLEEHFTSRMAIKFPSFDVLVYVRTYIGSFVEFGPRANIYMKNMWSNAITAYPAQGIVTDIKVQENMRTQFNKIEHFFPVGSQIFFIGKPYLGCEGTVLDPMMVYKCGRIQVNLCVRPEPELWSARRMEDDRDRDYLNAHKICRDLNISNRCLGRLTGTVWVVLGPRREKMENVSKQNIGLQLKYPRLNEERAGYCRRVNNQWFYSREAFDLICTYTRQFPEVIECLSTTTDRGEFVYEEDIYPQQMGQHLVEDVANWVRQQAHMKVDRVPCGSRTVCKETVQLMLNAIEDLSMRPVKNVKLQAKPHLLVKPNVRMPHVYRKPGTVRIFDRVVVVRTVYMVPVGITGTVIGIHPITDPNPVRLECLNSVEIFCELLFDRPVPNCGDIHGLAEGRVYKVPESALLIIDLSDLEDIEEPKPPRVESKFVQEGRENWRQQQGPSQFRSAATKTNNMITIKTHVPKIPTDAFGTYSTAPSTSAAAAAAVAAGTEAGGAAVPHPVEEIIEEQQQQPRREGGAAAPVQSDNQTQALKMLLGLKVPSDEVSSTPDFQSQTLLKPSPLSLRMTSQIPKLPQPPLFWQEQAKRQSEHVSGQQWDQHTQQMVDMPAASLVKGAQQQQHQHQHQQHQQHYQYQQRKQTCPAPQPNQTFNPGSNTNNPKNFFPRGQYNSNNGASNYYPTKCKNYNSNNYGANSNSNSNNNSNSNSNSNSNNNSNNSANVNQRRQYTSIQDFVPIQAYRPKRVSQRAGQGQAPAESGQKETGSKNSSVNASDSDAQQANSSVAAGGPSQAQSSSSSTPLANDPSSELMRTLKITPLNVEKSSSVASGEESVSAKPKIMRRPRMPRIGAKFDLEYIMP